MLVSQHRPMRFARDLALTLSIALISLSASAQAPSVSAIRDALRAHPTAADVDALLAALTTAGFQVERSPITQPDGTQSPRLVLAFAQPVRATAVARALGIRQACAFSPVVHQTSWIVESCRPYQPGRRAATPLTIGEWTIRVRLAGRPSGPIPSVSVGASPAYPLGASRVVSLEIEAR